MTEGLKSCPICTKRAVVSSNLFSEFKISKINHKKIIELVDKELKRTAADNNVTYDECRHSWIYAIKAKSVPVIISDISSYSQFINNMKDLCWLCIVIDQEANKDKLNNYNTLNFVRIEDIIINKIDISKQIDLIASTFDSNVTLELERNFNDYIKPISGQTFESEFVDIFFKAIKQKTGDLERYLRFLSAQKDTITNSKVVFMGWAANPDFATINLHEYIQSGLAPDRIGEAKRYHDLHSTQFTWSDFADALARADEADTLFILSTNNIAPSVWRRVIEKRRNAGYFKHVILDKDMILLLIKVLGIEDLMSKTLTPAKTEKHVK